MGIGASDGGNGSWSSRGGWRKPYDAANSSLGGWLHAPRLVANSSEEGSNRSQVCVYIYICICVCMYVYVYVLYILIYIYIYIHIYIYIYIYVCIGYIYIYVYEYR